MRSESSSASRSPRDRSGRTSLLMLCAVSVLAAVACERQAATSLEAGPGLDITGATSITNGGFETGTLSGWTSTGAVPITNGATYAHSGTYSADIGYNVTGSSTLSQGFTVPAGGAKLAFWFAPRCKDTSVTYAYFTATLTDTTANTTTTLVPRYCSGGTSAAYGVYQQVTSAALPAGHAMTLTMTNYASANSASYSNDTNVDDVVLTASGPPPANDFSLTAAPASATLAAGASTTITVTTAVTSGAAQSVSLTASGLPAGVTASFSPASVTAGATSTLTLTAASTAAAASATVTVTGTASSGAHTASVALTVTAAAGSPGLTNGGFETGSFSGWTTTGVASIVTASHSGTSAAQLGSTSPSTDSTAAQTFTAPAGATSLSFWYKNTCPDSVTYDWASATLKDNTAGTAVSTILPNTCVAAGAWSQVSAAVTAGHSYTLTLANHDDNYAGDPTYTQYDDVSIATGSVTNDFTIALSPASASVAAGGTVIYTVSTTVTGAAETLSLTVSGLPAGLTGAFSPASVAAGSNASLTLTAASAAAANAGTTFTVTGTGTSTNHTATASVAVTTGSTGGGSVGTNGGTVDHLFFAVVGDTRPGSLDATSSYPTAIITKIYQDLNAMAPKPQFILTTGDYMFAGTTAGTAQPQMNLYLGAQQNWTNVAGNGPVFAAMGNHECDGYTANNCTSLTQTQNIVAFMSGLVTPLGKALPYYAFTVNSTADGSTTKFISVACNYWNATQQSWLTSQLATATTHTVLFRHQDKAATTGPCVNTVESLMTQYPYDLSLVGHAHNFQQSGRQFIIGNGGAPQTAVPYGYATIERLSGQWQIKQYDYSTGLPVNTFTVTP